MTNEPTYKKIADMKLDFGRLYWQSGVNHSVLLDECLLSTNRKRLRRSSFQSKISWLYHPDEGEARILPAMSIINLPVLEPNCTRISGLLSKPASTLSPSKT